MIGNRLPLPVMDGWLHASAVRPPVRLTASHRHQLKRTARGHKSPHRDRLRAQIVLDAPKTSSTARAASTSTTPPTSNQTQHRRTSKRDHYHRAVAAWAHTAVPIFHAYRRAIAAAEAAHAALDETPDGRWRAALPFRANPEPVALPASPRWPLPGAPIFRACAPGLPAERDRLCPAAGVGITRQSDTSDTW
jgi:hypothetical protein